MLNNSDLTVSRTFLFTSGPDGIAAQQIKVPEYQKAPDYDLVMSQRLAAHQQQQPLEQMNQMNTMMNINQTGVYAHPAYMAYSQPDISAHMSIHGNPMAYNVQYIHPAQQNFYNRFNSVEHPYPGHLQHHTSDMAGMQSTYSMPDLNHNHQYSLSPNGTTLQFDSAGGLIAAPNIAQHNEMLLHHYKNNAHVQHTMYAPYPKVNSSSTPDLALQTHVRSDANNSPDLVSRRNLQHSVDDLTEIEHSDTGDRAQLELMTSRYVQEVMGNNGYGANNISTSENTNPWIPNNTSTPGYNISQNVVQQSSIPAHQLDIDVPTNESYNTDSSVTDHTYENLPSTIQQSDLNNSDSIMETSNSSTIRTTDNTDHLSTQIGFDNPAYGMPPSIDIADFTDGDLNVNRGAASCSADVSDLSLAVQSVEVSADASNTQSVDISTQNYGTRNLEPSAQGSEVNHSQQSSLDATVPLPSQNSSMSSSQSFYLMAGDKVCIVMLDTRNSEESYNFIINKFSLKCDILLLICP